MTRGRRAVGRWAVRMATIGRLVRGRDGMSREFSHLLRPILDRTCSFADERRAAAGVCHYHADRPELLVEMRAPGAGTPGAAWA